VPPNTTGTQLDVSVTDTTGHRATLGRVRVDGLPGTQRTASYWAREVRVPLAAAAHAGLDLHRIKSLDLTPRSRSGQAWLMDAWAWRPGTPAATSAPLPRVDIGRLAVKEGNSGVKTYRVPVQVTGRGNGQVRLYVGDPATGRDTSRLVTVRPGANSIDVPVKVAGNTRFDYGVQHDIFVKAVHGAVVGAHRGGVTTENDDPMPTFTVTPIADRVTEGQPLKWKVTLSAAADVELNPSFLVQPVAAGPELSTLDVNPQWLSENSGEEAAPERPLSKVLSLFLWTSVPPGLLSGEISVPTITDQVTEQPESVRFLGVDENGDPQSGGPELTGTVLDAP
jgi:hypothetical protein